MVSPGYGNAALDIRVLVFVPLIGEDAAFSGFCLYGQRHGRIAFPVRRARGLGGDHGGFHIHNGNLCSARNALRRFVMGRILVCVGGHTVIIESSCLVGGRRESAPGSAVYGCAGAGLVGADIPLIG